jgi:hypothetical protein
VPEADVDGDGDAVEDADDVAVMEPDAVPVSEALGVPVPLIVLDALAVLEGEDVAVPVLEGELVAVPLRLAVVVGVMVTVADGEMRALVHSSGSQRRARTCMWGGGGGLDGGCD